VKNIAIIGTGIAGLATAARLSAQGHKVTCFESNAYYGGKLTHFKLGNYRFDAGPSLFTMPQLVDDVFIFCKKDPRKYFNYNSYETTCHYFFEDGTFVQGYANPKKLAQEFHTKLGIDPKIVEQYLENSRKKFNRVGHIFMSKSLHKTKTWFSKDILKALLHLPSYKLLSTMHKVNEKSFQNPKLTQYFDRYATYNGSNPYAAPGLLTIIPHLEHGIGTFLPLGGMQSISDSIYNLCVEQGVQFHFKTKVTKIETTKNKTTGIFVDDKLLPQIKIPKKIEVQERSSSALIFYWGIKKEFEQLDLHSIFFSNNYEEEFEWIFKKQKVYHDPTVYINISSKKIKTDAPQGCENWFVMINLPCLAGRQAANKNNFNAEVKNEARKFIIEKINRILKTNIEDHIECEEILDPITIESKTGSLHGSLYGTSSNSRMAAFNRHANFTNKIKNLYFCGGSVHPGGGIPLCLNSAKIVSELIK
jgi:phytoene dehydrogenase-like protein